MSILGCMLIVYALTCCFPPMRYMDADYPYWMAQKDHVMANDSHKEILFLGDSLVKFGIIPCELSEESYILAIGGATPVEMYYTLKNYIEHHPVPKTVFVIFDPWHYQKYNENIFMKGLNYQYFNDDEVKEMNQTKRETIGKENPREIFSFRYKLPNVYMKPVLKSLVKNRSDENMKLYQKIKEHKGRMFNKNDNKSMTSIEQDGAIQEEFIYNAYLNVYMEKLIELCLEKNIPIYIEQAPKGNPAYQTLIDRGYIADYEAYMKQLQDKHHISVNPRIPLYPAENFWDELHLNEQGARKFTAEFREKYKSVFDGE